MNKTPNMKVTSVYVDLATNSETRLNTRDILLDIQTALDEVSDCPVMILDDNKLQRKHDFVLINIPDDENDYHMNIIPINRPGNDCHLHHQKKKVQ